MLERLLYSKILIFRSSLFRRKLISDNQSRRVMIHSPFPYYFSNFLLQINLTAYVNKYGNLINIITHYKLFLFILDWMLNEVKFMYVATVPFFYLLAATHVYSYAYICIAADGDTLSIFILIFYYNKLCLPYIVRVFFRKYASSL